MIKQADIVQSKIPQFILVSRHFLYAYAFIPKAACSTTKVILWRTEQEKNPFVGHLGDPMSVHLGQVRADSPWFSPLETDYLNNIKQKISKQIFIFSFVRNPYARIFSSYRNKILGVAKGVDKFDYLEQIGWRKERTPSFEEFLQIVSDQKHEERNEHWKTMTDLLCFTEISYSKIYKVENFTADISDLIERIFSVSSIGSQKATHVNATHSEETRRESYKPSSIKMVQDIYKNDFENFDYSFDYNIDEKSQA